MKLSQSFLLIATLTLFSSKLMAQQPQSLTPQFIINNAITAMGGKEYLLSIKTLYTDITTQMEGRNVHWITKEMLPNKGAFQIVYNDRIVFENWFNGKEGYEAVNGEKRKADPADFKDKKHRKNIFSELDYLDSSLWSLELAGEDKVAGVDCYKIKATLVNGAIKMLYYGKTTFYQLREDNLVKAEKDSFKTILFSGYKKYGPLTYYSTLKFGTEPDAQTGRIVNLIVNATISNKDFKK